MKRLLVMLCVGAMLVTGCGSGGSKTSEPTEKPSQGNKYVEQDFYNVLIYRRMQRESRRFISMR
mgnify:CR=1 FL=1